MSTEYTDSGAKHHAQEADRIKQRLERELGYEWGERPSLCDLWHLHKMMADVEESYGRMIHAQMPETYLKDEELNRKVLELSEWFRETSDEWHDKRVELESILSEAESAQYDLDKAEQDAKRAEERRLVKVNKMRKAGMLGM